MDPAALLLVVVSDVSAVESEALAALLLAAVAVLLLVVSQRVDREELHRTDLATEDVLSRVPGSHETGQVHLGPSELAFLKNADHLFLGRTL